MARGVSWRDARRRTVATITESDPDDGRLEWVVVMKSQQLIRGARVADHTPALVRALK